MLTLLSGTLENPVPIWGAKAPDTENHHKFGAAVGEVPVNAQTTTESNVASDVTQNDAGGDAVTSSTAPDSPEGRLDSDIQT